MTSELVDKIRSYGNSIRPSSETIKSFVTVCVGAAAFNYGRLFIQDHVIEPVSPPAIEYELSADQIAQRGSLEGFLSPYEDRGVKLTMKPVFVNYTSSQDSSANLEIGLQSGENFIKVRSSSLIGFLRKSRMVSPERLQEVHGILKGKIASGLESITVSGSMDDGVLRAYSVNIEGKEYPLLR